MHPGGEQPAGARAAKRRPVGVPQFAQRLRLDLPDPFARHFEVLADLLEGVIALFPDAVWLPPTSSFE